MKIDIGGRCSGKTTRGIIYLLQNPKGMMVVHSYKSVHVMEGIWPALRGRFIIFKDYINGELNPKEVSGIYIDNLDECLRHFSMCNIDVVTLNG